MNQPSPAFTNLRISNGLNPKSVTYASVPELLSGDLQLQCQTAFKAHMANGSDFWGIFNEFKSLFGEGLHLELDMIMVNIALAASRPCEDYEALFEYLYAFCEQVDDLQIRRARDTTQWIKLNNPVNPYLAFKAAPITLWGKMEDALDLIESNLLIKLAAVFDDVPMMEKILSFRPIQFDEIYTATMASMVFDPLSRVRAWKGEPEGISMREVEERIKIQANAISTSKNSRIADSLSNSLPEMADIQGFHPGEFRIEKLKVASKDHMLRLMPRYTQFVRHSPWILTESVDAAMAHQGVAHMMPHFIKDLEQAGESLIDIHFRYVNKMSCGEFQDLSEVPGRLEKVFMEEILSVGQMDNDEHNTGRPMAMATLLSMAGGDLIDRYAKTDDQLASAYQVTGHKKYLERMSEAGMDNQLSEDLGL